MSVADDWPGGARRHPSKRDISYLIRAPLASWLQQQARRGADDLGRYRVLDVGCGIKPYYPFFEPYAGAYVGVDIEHPGADLDGSVESLPVPDASFDLVLCTQVLEHSVDPDQAVRELWRVTRPGGRVLASTHGVQCYHPSPEDYWRWTHVGLEQLFRRNGSWREVTITPAGGTTSCLAAMTDIYVDLLFRRMHLSVVGKSLVWLLNTTAEAIDARVAELSELRQGSLIVNYHVAADKGLETEA